MKIALELLEKTVVDTQGWVNAIADRMNVKNGNLALASLRATLPAIRDQLDTPRAAAFAAQLPLFLKGLFFDGWRPNNGAARAATREEFLTRIQREFFRNRGVKAERMAKAALEVINERVPAAAMAELIPSLPEDLRSLWPDEPLPYPEMRGTQPLRTDLEEQRKSRTSPSRLRRATRRAPGQVNANALPERHRSSRATARSDY